MGPWNLRHDWWSSPRDARWPRCGDRDTIPGANWGWRSGRNRRRAGGSGELITGPFSAGMRRFSAASPGPPLLLCGTGLVGQSMMHGRYRYYTCRATSPRRRAWRPALRSGSAWTAWTSVCGQPYARSWATPRSWRTVCWRSMPHRPRRSRTKGKQTDHGSRSGREKKRAWSRPYGRQIVVFSVLEAAVARRRGDCDLVGVGFRHRCAAEGARA